MSVSALWSEALVEGPITDTQSFYLAGRRSYLDLVVSRVEGEGEGATFEVPEFWDYQGKYVWDPGGRDRLRLSIGGAGDDVQFAIAGDSELGRQEPVLAGRSTSAQAYHSQAAVWDHRFGAHASNTLALALGHGRHTDRTRIGTAADQEVTLTSVTVREQLRLQAGERHTLLLGADVEHLRAALDLDAVNPRCTEFDPECDLTGGGRESVEESLRINLWSLYLKDRVHLGRGLWGIGGLRYSREDYLGGAFTEPRLGLEWEATDQTVVSAGWGRHHQFPEGDQVLEKFGNPRLRHLRAEHTTLGVAHDFGRQWRVDAQVYYKTFRDFVIADPAENYVNGASGEAYGLELLVKRNPVGRFSGWLALTLARSERQNDETGETFPFDYDQPVAASLVADYRLSPRWSFGARWQYHSGTPYTPVVGTGTYPDGRTRPLYGDLNSRRVPPYHRLDLRVDRHFTFTTWKLDLYAELINAYHRRNVSGYTYATPTGARSTSSRSSPASGSAPRFSSRFAAEHQRGVWPPGSREGVAKGAALGLAAEHHQLSPRHQLGAGRRRKGEAARLAYREHV